MRADHDFPEAGMIPLRVLLRLHEKEHDDPDQEWHGSPGSSRSPGFTAMRRRARVERDHGDMSPEELRAHMRQHGFIDTPDDPDWVIDETHRGEHADAPLEHVHPDLDDEYGEDIHLGDQDWMRQVGIEPPRSHW